MPENMNDNADIRVVAGIKGGASIDGVSGTLIRAELLAISNQISAKHLFKISASLRDNTATRLQKELDQIAEKVTLNVNANVSAAGKQSGGPSKPKAPKTDFSAQNFKFAETQLLKIQRLIDKIKGADYGLTFDVLGDDHQATQKNLQAIDDLLVDIKSRLNDIKTDDKKLDPSVAGEIRSNIAALDNYIQKYNQAYVQQQRAQNSVEDFASKSKDALANLNRYLTTVNPKGLQEFSHQIQVIRNLLSDGTEESFKKASTAIRNLKADMKLLGYEGGNFITYLTGKIKTFTTYLMSTFVTGGFIGAIKKMKDNVVTLDKAMTDLMIVTGDTRTTTEELIRSYNKMARQLGTTTANVATGATDWLRQGYSEAESKELLKQSMTLSIVGAMESTEATDALTASLKGYQLAVQDASGVVDKFFTVDMRAATSASALALALSKTAANAKLAGLSLDDVIGQLAVVNETMKESGEETGTFYNTMLSRMAMIKSGRLEDPESGEDLSDVETTLRGLDIKLRDTAGQFRNFGIVLDEVGKSWDTYSSTQQRAIAVAFAGTRQQTRFLTLMQGYSKAGEYAEAAANSAGIAAEKLATYQESLEAKANKMTAAFEKMSTSYIPTAVIGGFYDLMAILFDVGSAASGLVITIGGLTAAILGSKTAIDAFKASSFHKSIADFGKDLGTPNQLQIGVEIIVPSYSKNAA